MDTHAIMRFRIPTLSFFAGLLLWACGSEEPTAPLFKTVPSEESGLVFENRLTENDSINILDNEFVYNGSGVAIGDLNGDGWDDLFLAGNQVDNALYLNQGSMKFKEVTEESKIGKPDSLLWSSGVNLVDLNQDGRLDVYICNTFYRDSVKRRNLLYINQGNGTNEIPMFKELGQAYGLADDTYSSHAQFFDYDRDGDLDLFIGVNRIEGINPSDFRPVQDDGTSMSRDRLYENRWDEQLGHPVFVNVSEQAGIQYHGYSHSTLIHDFNKDGWPDIYVANDFMSNDLVYLNNQDGTFTNKAGAFFKHFSLSSMGSDLADINNDGEMDLVTTEMQPYYNKRKKLFQGPSSYNKEIFTRRYDYEYQYARNTLQVASGKDPETGLPLYSETGMLSGIQETDWSWAPLFADYDNDGLQDLFITNGFPKDVTDRDFGDFRVTASRLVSKEELIEAIPEIKIPNFAFKNMGDLKFEDVTREWGLNYGTFSSGAAYGDLDKDGDLDLVVNNLNQEALLLENKGNELYPDQHYLRVRLEGTPDNAQGFGAVVSLFVNGDIQRLTMLSGRGYLSKPESVLHFGLGELASADSLRVVWPDGAIQNITDIPADQEFLLKRADASASQSSLARTRSPYVMEPLDSIRGLNVLVRDIDFIDFNFQRTLPHKFSQYGPALSAGDVNGDGLTDVFVPGSRSFSEIWLLQQGDGSFVQEEARYKEGEGYEEDSASLLFDADGDQDLDLYLGRGSAQYAAGDPLYRDMLLLNDGSGSFEVAEAALPVVTTNTSVIRASDFDQDGDLDLFVGSRVLPRAYPMADRSYLLRNDSQDGIPKFTDITKAILPEMQYAGLISDALWTDFNGDSWPDLILAAEWSPLRFFENKKGRLQEITASSGIASEKGWWNSLAAADLDNDGDIDYIAGNSGKNTLLRGTPEQPVRLYAKDLDQNGMIDPLISYFLRDSIGEKREYLYHPWQDVVKQYPDIRRRFNSFGAFGSSTLPEMFSDGLLEDAEVFELNTMETSWIENLGDGRFKRHALPLEVQIAPIFGIIPSDVNSDGHTDILLVGNDYGMEVQQGRADAFNGALLMNSGAGTFSVMHPQQSGFYVPGDAKALLRLQASDGALLYLASQNNDETLAFEQAGQQVLRLEENEVRAVLELENGSKKVFEAYWGSGFGSQSERLCVIPETAVRITTYDSAGTLSRELPIGAD